MSITRRIRIWLTGKFVGKDSYGNVYYEQRKKTTDLLRKTPRWVLFKGRTEASKVPPEWHAWLHHLSDAPLTEKSYPWQKSHKQNPTGLSEHRDTPKIVKLNVEKKKKYEPWLPK